MGTPSRRPLDEDPVARSKAELMMSAIVGGHGAVLADTFRSFRSVGEVVDVVIVLANEVDVTILESFGPGPVFTLSWDMLCPSALLTEPVVAGANTVFSYTHSLDRDGVTVAVRQMTGPVLLNVMLVLARSVLALRARSVGL